MQESLVPYGNRPLKRRKSPSARDSNRVGPSRNANEENRNNKPSTKDENINNGEQKERRIPMLIRGIGVHSVIPKEATRDVLSGKVSFYLVDDRQGVTLFSPKHIFSALKLDKEHVKKFEDYSCVGAHQRIFEKKPRRREGMGYRRRYIDPELINRGIYTHFFDTCLPREFSLNENQLERGPLYRAWERQGLTNVKDYSPDASFHRVYEIKPRFYSSPSRVYRQPIYGGCYILLIGWYVMLCSNLFFLTAGARTRTRSRYPYCAHTPLTPLPPRNNPE